MILDYRKVSKDMPMSKEDDQIYFDSRTEGTFADMLHQMMVFVHTLKANQNASKAHAELEKYLEEISYEKESLKEKIDFGLPIMPESLKKLANDLNQASTLLHMHRFSANKDKILSDLIALGPQTKRVDSYSDDKQNAEIHKRIMHITEQIRNDAEIIRTQARPKDMPFLQKLTMACEDFSTHCKEKLLSNIALK